MKLGRPATLLPNIDLSHIPDSPGAYLFKDGSGQVLFVGSSTRLNQRVKSQLRSKSFARAGSVSTIEFELSEDIGRLPELERRLVDKLSPVYNSKSTAKRVLSRTQRDNGNSPTTTMAGTIQVNPFLASMQSRGTCLPPIGLMIPLSGTILTQLGNNICVEVTLKSAGSVCR